MARCRCSCCPSVTLKERTKLVLLVLFNIVWAVIDKLLKKRVQNVFGTRYAIFQAQLSNLAYAVIVSVTFLLAIIFLGLRVRKSERTVKMMLKLILVGIFDGLKHFLESIGGPSTPGSLQVLLSGLNLVFTIVCSLIILKSRYHWAQYLGALIMIFGVPAGAIPKFISGTKDAVWYSVVIYGAHSVPDSLATTLKDLFLVKVFPVLWLLFVTSWTEFLFGWAYSPVVLLPAFGGADNIGTVLLNGTLCFAGDTAVPVWKGDKIIGHCGELSLILTLLYMGSHAIKNVAQVFLVKHGTASLVMTVEMVQIPFSALVFSIPVIGTEEFSWFNILGLVVVFIGFALYVKFGEEFKRRKTPDEETRLLVNS